MYKRSAQGPFLVMGIVSMAWVPRIPEMKEQLQLCDGQLGLVLVSSSLELTSSITDAIASQKSLITSQPAMY